MRPASGAASSSLGDVERRSRRSYCPPVASSDSVRTLSAPSWSVEAGRIVAGEAGVAELRRVVVAAGFADGAVEPVDRQEGEASTRMKSRHLLDRHARGEQLGLLRRVDAVEAGRAWSAGWRCACALRCAPASRTICTIFGEVVPRTIESSTSTTRLPSSSARLALCFSLHAHVADRVGRLDEGAADIVVADDAEIEGEARRLREADRRRRAGIGHRHDDVGLGRRFRAPARRRCACAPRRRCGPRRSNPAARNRHIRRCRSAASAAANGNSALDALGR